MGPKQQTNEEMAKKRKSFGIWQLAAALKPPSPNPQLWDELAKISADKWQTRRRHHGQPKSKTESSFEVRVDNQNPFESEMSEINNGVAYSYGRPFADTFIAALEEISSSELVLKEHLSGKASLSSLMLNTITI